ncbi:MAG TPA: hypothetical protein VFI13_11745 [Gemmatimonadales bacterium]|nr:hypothetical protein [Gemmatimonadales bacterium]
MRTRRLPILLLVLAACARGPKESPVAVVESLYSTEMFAPIRGLPTADQARHLAPFLGDSLNRLLERAQAIQDSEARAHPDEKPSWADGDLFTSLFEGPTSFYALAPARGTPIKVPVRFTRDDNGQRLEWTDTALVARRGDTWVIEDVLYGGTWGFAPHGSLRAQLSR